jgi:hypothetical protein
MLQIEGFYDDLFNGFMMTIGQNSRLAKKISNLDE